ncbi:nitroreductase family protein, partial [bacterium]|nr:nitroreductase family protein [bacterium]
RAAAHAPTGGNLQPYSIIDVRDAGTKEKLAEMCGGQRFVTRAPVALVFCIDYHRLERWARLEGAPFSARDTFMSFWIAFQDTIIAAQNACTAADAMGLGSVYVGSIMSKFSELREMLELPKGVFPLVFLSLGYPKNRPEPRRKLPPAVFVHHERYAELPDDELRAAFDEKYNHAEIEALAERVATIEKVVRRMHGDAEAERSVSEIRSRGFITIAQRYFGLHYRADLMPLCNESMSTSLKEAGFGCLEPFEHDWELDDEEAGG